MAKPTNDVRVAHGGTCPPGYIFNHDKTSKGYGKCIPVTNARKKVTMTKTK